jgi:hypothetical protein
LLTNVVMAWNTARMQGIVDARWGPRGSPVLARIAPVAFGHINMRGTFNFSLGALRHRLIDATAEPQRKRA